MDDKTWAVPGMSLEDRARVLFKALTLYQRSPRRELQEMIVEALAAVRSDALTEAAEMLCADEEYVCAESVHRYRDGLPDEVALSA